MDVMFSEQSDFDPVSAVKKLRLDLERRLLSNSGLRATSAECFTTTPIENQETKDTPKKLLAAPGSVCRSRFFRLTKAVKIPYRERRMSESTNNVLSLRWLWFLNFSNHSLTLVGITVLFFAILCIIRGWYSDLSLGLPIFTSGLAMIAIGFAGRFLAK